MSNNSKTLDLKELRSTIETMGGTKMIDKVHKEGKYTARERINFLLDSSSFVEIGAYVTQRTTNFNMGNDKLMADGIVTGYGTINNRLIFVYAMDVTTMGGSIGEMGALKIAKIYDNALKVGAPVIALVESSGFRLQEETDALNALGTIYAKQSLASGVIPQFSCVFGECGGGISVLANMSDFVFMTENSKMYLNSPITWNDSNNNVEKFATAEFNAINGMVDVIIEKEEDVFTNLRELVEILPANNNELAGDGIVNDDLNRKTNINTSKGLKGSNVITEIADNNSIFEIKEKYASEVVTAFAKINGNTVAFIANNTTKEEGKLTAKGLEKATAFVKFADAYSIPIVTITDVIGFASSKQNEESAIALSAAKLTNALINATVAKVNIIVGRAYGSAYVCFNSKHIGADVVLAYPKSKVAIMNSESAVRIMYAEELDANMSAEEFNKKVAEYENNQANPLRAATRGYIDDIIEPEETRQRIVAALEMLFTKQDNTIDRKHVTKG